MISHVFPDEVGLHNGKDYHNECKDCHRQLKSWVIDGQTCQVSVENSKNDRKDSRKHVQAFKILRVTFVITIKVRKTHQDRLTVEVPLDKIELCLESH